MNDRIVIVAGRHRSLAQPGSAAMAHRCGRLFGEAVLAAAIAGREMCAQKCYSSALFRKEIM